MQFENELHETLFNLFVINFSRYKSLNLNREEIYTLWYNHRSALIKDFKKEIFIEVSEEKRLEALECLNSITTDIAYPLNKERVRYVVTIRAFLESLKRESV